MYIMLNDSVKYKCYLSIINTYFPLPETPNQFVIDCIVIR